MLVDCDYCETYIEPEPLWHCRRCNWLEGIAYHCACPVCGHPPPGFGPRIAGDYTPPPPPFVPTAPPVDWRDALAGAKFIAGLGVSTVYADFDFETYSEAGYVWNPTEQKWDSPPGLSNVNRGLGAVGTRNYVQHRSFRLLSLAWNLKDGKGKRHWKPNLDQILPPYTPETAHLHPAELLEYVRSGGVLEAWGAMFEWQVWNFYCVPVLGWPYLHEWQIRDAMAKSRASAYPGGLKDAGEVLNISERKDPAGEKLIRKLTVPRKPTKGNPALRWTPFTAAEDFQKFYAYNEQDIRAEAEASIRLQDLTEREFKVWKLDFRINMRGMQIDTESVEHCIAIIEQAEAKYHAELSQITNGAVKKSTEVQPMLRWMQGQGVALYELDEDTLSAALKRIDYPRNVLRVLRIRQILAFGSVKKYYAYRAQTTAERRLYEQYVFYGAHTALWNGRGVQPANLYKGIFSKPEQVEFALSLIRTRCLELLEYHYGEGSEWAEKNGGPVDALEVIASCLRSMIVAKPGHRLISADFTSIQAVGTSCMANEAWRIEVFRTHGKYYESIASQLTGRPLQFYIDYKQQNKKHHDDRQLGKLAGLSGDFGAWINGWKRFGAQDYGDDYFIKQLILKTRAAMPNVVNFWGGQTIDKFQESERKHYFGLEGAAVSAILEPDKCFSNRPGSRLAVLYQTHEDTLYCKPPSGGFIRYHKPRLQKSMRDYASPWEYEMSYEGWNTNPQKGRPGWLRMKLYGGVQTQNVISHMCREVQADRLIALEEAGYPIVMHTHDENVAEIPDDFGSLEEYNAIMRVRPDWAICEDGQPWPIKVPDAWIENRYGKWED